MERETVSDSSQNLKKIEAKMFKPPGKREGVEGTKGIAVIGCGPNDTHSYLAMAFSHREW